MCVEPVSIMMAIGSAVASYGGAVQQSNAQTAAYDQNRINAVSAAGDRYSALNLKAVQERDSASRDLEEKQRKGLEARARAATAAGEANVTGLSVDAMENDLLAQQAHQMEAIRANYDNQLFGVKAEMDSTYHQTKSRIASVRPGASVSPIPYLFQAAGSMFGSARGSTA